MTGRMAPLVGIVVRESRREDLQAGGKEEVEENMTKHRQRN